MSICDRCFSPGACCKQIKLSYSRDGEWFPHTFWDDTPVEEQTKDWDNFPFRPIEKLQTHTDPASSRTYGEWKFMCPRLLPEGRCGDYENRPELCRSYEPGSDQLCVHFQGAEGTGDGL